MNTYIFKAALLVFIFVAMTSCAAKRVEIYRDRLVKVEEADPPFLIVNVHGSTTRFLTIRGETFRGVTGIAPFYLDVPELDSILFVTRGSGPGGQAAIHVVKKRLKGAISIDIGDHAFGDHIGQSIGAESDPSDYVEKVDQVRVWLVSQRLLTKTTFVINLQQKSLEKVESVTLDESGQVKRRYTMPLEQIR